MDKMQLGTKTRIGYAMYRDDDFICSSANRDAIMRTTLEHRTSDKKNDIDHTWTMTKTTMIVTEEIEEI